MLKNTVILFVALAIETDFFPNQVLGKKKMEINLYLDNPFKAIFGPTK